MGINNLGAWLFKDAHVQPDNLQGGQNFVSSESIVLAAGPQKVPADITSCLPIGLLENVTIAQNKELKQLFEIGSRQSYFLPGRTFIQVNLTRVVFNGPSLLKAMNAWTPSGGVNTPAADPWPYASGGNPIDDIPDSDPDDGVDDSVTQQLITDDGTAYHWDPGYGPVFVNVASDFFNRPFGLALLINDSENDKYGGMYLEQCNIQSHNFSITGQQTVVMENAVARCTGVVPVNWDDIPADETT